MEQEEKQVLTKLRSKEEERRSTEDSRFELADSDNSKGAEELVLTVKDDRRFLDNWYVKGSEDSVRRIWGKGVCFRLNKPVK